MLLRLPKDVAIRVVNACEASCVIDLRASCARLRSIAASWTGTLMLTDTAMTLSRDDDGCKRGESLDEKLHRALALFPEMHGLSWSETGIAASKSKEQPPGPASTGITDEALACVGRNLRRLELVLCSDISGRGVALALDRAPRMRVLSILSSYGVMDDTRWISHAACARLEQLELACVALSAEAVSTVASHCTQLRALSLGDGGDADFEGVGEEVAWPHLWSLTLHAMRNVDGILRAASLTGRLRQLDVTDCEFPLPSIRVVAERSPMLTELDLSGCSGVTDWTIAVVLRQCVALEWLELFMCPRVTNHAANLIQRATAAGGSSPRLRGVGLSRTVEESARRRLREARPALSIM